MSHIKSLSVIIPAFNEMLALNDALDEVVNTLDCSGITFEIIVINDGSTDNSSDVLLLRSSTDCRIRSINHEHNSGKGKALRTGFENSSASEWILVIDADRQIPLTTFFTFVESAQNADIIIGNRVDKQYTLYRKFVSFVNRWLVRALLGVKVYDINCPFKLIRAEILQGVILSANGFGIDAELIWKLSKKGAGITELPVESRPRQTGTSKVTPRMLVKCLQELLALRFSTDTRVKP